MPSKKKAALIKRDDGTTNITVDQLNMWLFNISLTSVKVTQHSAVKLMQDKASHFRLIEYNSEVGWNLFFFPFLVQKKKECMSHDG